VAASAQTSVPAEAEAVPSVSQIVVAYVSEVPWPSYAGMANPLERWARQISASWASPASESHARLSNLCPEQSLRQIYKDAGKQAERKADVYLVHGYELLEQGTPASLAPLLVPSCNGKAGMAEFVILRRRDAVEGAGGVKFSMNDLRSNKNDPRSKKNIPVDRAGCGELVYRWLDVELMPVSGDLRRENFAEFRTATNAAEAVLSVYFGEADACVVSREDYAAVLRTNPAGLQSKVEVVYHSPRLLRHVVACRRDMSQELRQELVKHGGSVRMPYQGIVWSLTQPSEEDMKALKTLHEQWQRYFSDKPGPGPAPAAPAARPQEAAAVSDGKERRLP